jgi:hypothetical protein
VETPRQVVEYGLGGDREPVVRRLRGTLGPARAERDAEGAQLQKRTPTQELRSLRTLGVLRLRGRAVERRADVDETSGGLYGESPPKTELQFPL